MVVCYIVLDLHVILVGRRKIPNDFANLVTFQITGLCSSNDAAQTPLKIGDCLMTDYLASMKKCETSFVKKLQGNKNANCR